MTFVSCCARHGYARIPSQRDSRRKRAIWEQAVKMEGLHEKIAPERGMIRISGKVCRANDG
jgi:hypothetical protein